MRYRRQRLERLERRIFRTPILLYMPDGSTVKLPGEPRYVLDLMMRCLDGEESAVMDLVAQSHTSDEPGGAQMIGMARLLHAAMTRQTSPGESST